MANPVLAEVWRGGIVESRHRGAIAVTGPGGRTLLKLGDIETDIFPRSAIKLFQALPLIETGAADAFGFDNAALALACASHNGEVRHVEKAGRMLTTIGLDVSALECGSQRPMGSEASWKLAEAQGTPSALHNNCSGKHAGMLATAVHLDEGSQGYIKQTHPIQLRIRDAMERLTEAPLASGPCGIDGCSVPTWALPLEAMARAFTRLITGEDAGARHQAAAARLLAACAAEPEMTSGAGRRCAELIRFTDGEAYAKVGAEGVYGGAIPSKGIGIALKIDDGAFRAAEVAIATVLTAFLPAHAEPLQSCREVTMTNWNGFEVGTLLPSDTLKQALAAMP